MQEEGIEKIWEFLKKLEEHSKELKEWEYRGNIYLDFIKIKKNLQETVRFLFLNKKLNNLKE